LRDVFFEFIQRYGPEEPFDDEAFLGLFVKATHPEIADFFRRYVEGNEPLPYAEVFAEVGVAYDPTQGSLTLMENATPEQLALRESWAF